MDHFEERGEKTWPAWKEKSTFHLRRKTTFAISTDVPMLKYKPRRSDWLNQHQNRRLCGAWKVFWWRKVLAGKNLRDEKLTRELGFLKSIVAASALLDQRKSEKAHIKKVVREHCFGAAAALLRSNLELSRSIWGKCKRGLCWPFLTIFDPGGGNNGDEGPMFHLYPISQNLIHFFLNLGF